MWRNNVYNLWCFVAFYNILLPNQFFLQFTLFCREISFGTIYALLCGEKFSQNCARGEKMTNMRYANCLSSHEIICSPRVIFHDDGLIYI